MSNIGNFASDLGIKDKSYGLASSGEKRAGICKCAKIISMHLVDLAFSQEDTG